jgi:hypothetical protein
MWVIVRFGWVGELGTSQVHARCFESFPESRRAASYVRLRIRRKVYVD